MSITWGASSARNGSAANCVAIFGLLFGIVQKLLSRTN
jgi:hypothetical protein